MAKVVLDGVVKRFGPVTAVHDLNIEIADREFVTLVGPSGCGKTTTLRMIAGLEKVSAGQIFFDDDPVGHLPADHRDIAMVFQSYALYPHMNVYDNIGFALRMMRVPRPEIERRVNWAAEMLGIAELLQRKPRQLSGGQRQRVALGRSVVREPACFLLDEPLSNLDAQLRVTMRGELKRLHLELRRTFIYVTHDQAEALTMSDRIAVISDGRLQQYGPPDEIYVLLGAGPRSALATPPRFRCGSGAGAKRVPRHPPRIHRRSRRRRRHCAARRAVDHRARLHPGTARFRSVPHPRHRRSASKSSRKSRSPGPRR